MADVLRGDVLEATAGPYSGDKFRVRGVDDWNARQRRIAPIGLYDSEVTVDRGGATVNPGGQTSRSPTPQATGVKCSIQAGFQGQSETGWGQVGTGGFTIFFDDKVANAEYTEEVLNV